MATRSSIEWTESTWNPLTGCTKISPGCRHCYAEKTALRLRGMSHPNYVNGFKLTLHEQVLETPLSWKKPQMVFVNSMSDLFHADVPEEFIMRVFDVMREAWWHQFQVLTKRSQRLLELSPLIDWPCNVWMGVSVESEDYVGRGVPFFFKQWGGVNKKAAGRLLQGRTWDQMPVYLKEMRPTPVLSILPHVEPVLS